MQMTQPLKTFESKLHVVNTSLPSLLCPPDLCLGFIKVILLRTDAKLWVLRNNSLQKYDFASFSIARSWMKFDCNIQIDFHYRCRYSCLDRCFFGLKSSHHYSLAIPHCCLSSIMLKNCRYYHLRRESNMAGRLEFNIIVLM